jgi:hypothetical protein
MAYFSQERKAQIAPKVKAILKKYGIQGSLSVRHHSTVVLTLKSGAIDFIGDINRTCGADQYQVSRGFQPIRDYTNVNPYHYQSHHSGRALAFLKEVMPVLNTGNHDNSDAQTDYFDVGWYTEIKIGKWNAPYKVEG